VARTDARFAILPAALLPDLPRFCPTTLNRPGQYRVQLALMTDLRIRTDGVGGVHWFDTRYANTRYATSRHLWRHFFEEFFDNLNSERSGQIPGNCGSTLSRACCQKRMSARISFS
jgi:hypothetical protein